jgi:glycosyltransferase involved in cell wall biosynthesis
VGRLLEIKGVAYLLRAMPRVLARHPGIGLLVVGYGERQQALRADAERLGIGSAVRFAGRRSREEVARSFRGCRLAVVPSIERADGRAEGMPTVLLEALASGVRVVATATGGIPDVLRHGENGWLCRDRDPEDLAEKILCALDDPRDSRVPHSARETARRFDWPRVAERYAEVFERLSTL